MDAVFSNFDAYLQAFGITIGLFVVSGIASLGFGVLLAAARVGPISVLRSAAAVYVTLFRNTPLLMIFIFMAVAMPKLGYNFKGIESLSIGDRNVSAFFFRSCLALTLYTSAFVCEAFRAGVNAVPLGQAEASRAIGLRFGQSMTLVVLPQALRAVVPPLANVLIALVKNTSIAAVFGMAEAASTMRSFSNDNADQRPQIFLLFALGYILVVEVVAMASYAAERRWKVST